MKILVTGANGFIGSYCMSYFYNQGYDVTGLVRRFPPVNKYKYNVHDLNEKITWEEKFDVIIHTAARAGNDNRMDAYVEDNIIATKNLLEYAEKKASALINLGSVSSFGIIKENIISENTIINGPGFYGITKYVSEKMVLESKLPTISLILPGIVGKNGQAVWLMRVAKKMITGESVECYDPESLFNNILHIDTLTECIHRIIKKNIYTNERILLGSRNPMTKYNVLTELKTLLSSQSSIDIVESDLCSFILDIKEAQKKDLVLNDVRGELVKFANELLEKICD